MRKSASIIEDANGNKIVKIHHIIFEGKRNIDRNAVKIYLKQYVGMHFKVVESDDLIHIGLDFPIEYTGSEYTIGLKGARAKAKANATQGLGEIVTIATQKKYQENFKSKHRKTAKYGWYRFSTRFALPVCAEDGTVNRHNVFTADLLVRHDADDRKYLYDIINVKKEQTLLE